MIDLEYQKKQFKDHKATFTDYGNIKILDFQKPGCSHYRIRFMFEEDYYRLHISGDLGELIATNFKNMNYEDFSSDFVNNIGYFEEKIDCHSRRIYEYDVKKARKELEEKAEEYEWEIDQDEFDDIFEYYSDISGISSDGIDALMKLDPDAWEWSPDLGKEETGILDLYMLAFKLAQKQLKEEEA